eukprot:CAMPEP_0119056122 /NCGR_PEP_ID=MMETSP1178-20130426/822_1 /TAXON_ID=33656 /ORGANISM="unid sp, Strain CCMP2000" /LENGTH=152 /DNA_ID=CAMNT_0007036819 /DNA_START=178 /DNA_END=634 /DNA_ORIENTATION=+
MTAPPTHHAQRLVQSDGLRRELKPLPLPSPSLAGHNLDKLVKREIVGGHARVVHLLESDDNGYLSSPFATVATVPHSWNQYDSGRMMRTTEPRVTISTLLLRETTWFTPSLLAGATKHVHALAHNTSSSDRSMLICRGSPAVPESYWFQECG